MNKSSLFCIIVKKKKKKSISNRSTSLFSDKDASPL